jgi:dUTP pyrophosphatase
MDPKIKIIASGGIPTAQLGDGWWDLSASKEVVIPSFGIGKIPTGLKMELPCKAQIFGRSGLAARGRFPVGGCIDQGYRGEWFVVMVNLSGSSWHIKVGDRIAQFAFEDKFWNPETRTLIWDVVKSFEGTTELGEKGFVSSGD